jgi:pyridoxal phosphate enzyme (YggS family)
MQTAPPGLEAVRTRIADACRAAGRDPAGVTLLAVSKKHPADAVRALAGQGQRDFGENYVNEAVDKIRALADLELCWHFIGPLQSNKTRDVAEHFDWVHSVDRARVARRLSEQRPSGMDPLNVCLQINIDREPDKSGADPDAARELAELVQELPGLRLRGLMAVPRADAEDRNRAAFQELAMTLSHWRPTMPGLDTLSMGMSGDYDVAIEEGATIVRLGTALFGARD